MPENSSKRQHGIELLLAERKKYEAWIIQLETRRATTAEHVFTRVHADYTKRLHDVRERLGAEADGIKALVAELEGRLATEQRLVTEKSDERAELELRAIVGEFSEKEWNATRSKLDAAIGEIRAKFAATERELTDMRETLRSVVAVPVAAPRTPKAEPGAKASRVSDPVKPAVGGPAAAPTEPEPPVPPRAKTPFDELAFLKSVAGTPTTPTPIRAVPEFMADTEPVSQLQPEGEPEPIAPEPEPEPQPEPEPEPERSALGAPTPRTSQAVRTLKCQECGTLNFPTEWYCERCGGELAAF